MKLRTVIAIATIVPLISIGVAVVPRLANERWEQMVAWQAKTEQEWRQRDYRRPPAWGSPESGAALPFYVDALQQARVLGKADARLLVDLRQRPTAVDDAAAAAFALRWRSALEAMQQGAHRDDARPAIEWARGINQPGLRMLDGRDLVNAAGIEVRARIGRGDGTHAVQLLLDAMTLAVDTRMSPLMVDQIVASAWLGIAAESVLAEPELLRLDDGTLQLLANGLAVVDGRWCSCIDGSGETMLLARSLIDAAAAQKDSGGGGADAGEQAPVDAAPGWHYGWSRRWCEADAVMTLVGAYAELEQSRGLSWPQRRECLTQLETTMKANANAIVRAIAPVWQGAERALRDGAARLRLLRVAVAARLGGPLPELADPLGDGPLQVERDGDVVTVRSAGGSDAHPIERQITAR